MTSYSRLARNETTIVFTVSSNKHFIKSIETIVIVASVLSKIRNYSPSFNALITGTVGEADQNSRDFSEASN